MAKKKWFSTCLRYPRTRQELRANQDRNNPYCRGKRKKLPTAWDDQYVNKQKSWKYIRRNHQYRDCNHNYKWHVFYYTWRDSRRRIIARNIMDGLEKMGCFYESISGGFHWYGPGWWIKDHCRHCYTELISDFLSEEYGDWCPNPNCYE